MSQATEHCNNCGLCCMKLRTPPHMPDEWEMLPPELQDEIIAWQISPRKELQGDDDMPCVWLDVATGSCKHYEHRPEICREFEPGNETCREYREAVGLTVEGLPLAIGGDE